MTTVQEIQNLYDRLCRKYNLMSVHVSFVSGVEEYRGLYVERPFRKIYLNQDFYNLYVIYHEFLHHLFPDLNDGPEFDDRLYDFMLEEANVVDMCILLF